MASLKEIEEAKLAAEALNTELGFLEDAFTSIGQKIKDEVEYNLIGVTKETKKVGEIFSKNLNKAISQNAASLKNIGNLQAEINKGVNVEAKIQKELSNIAARKRTIQRQQNNLTANGIKLDKELSSQLNAQFYLQEDTLATLTEQNVERQKEKSLLTLLGEGGANLLNQLDKSGTASKLMKLNLSDTVTPMRLMEVAIGFIVEAFISLDATTEKVAQNLGISFHEAAAMNPQFAQIAKDSNNIFVTTKGIAEAQIQLSAALGTNAMFSAEMLQTQTELTTQLKLSEGTSAEIAKLGLLTGKTSKEIAANVMGQSVAMNAANGTALTEKSILQEVANLSSSIQLSMANNPIELAKAVQTAKQFGMELSNVDSIAGGLLNFEASIGAELEAELLLGKNINLEKARQAALNNDLATVAEEIAKQAGSAAEFTAMNRIQQEALAKAVGMSREDLAKSLQSREILAALGGKDADMQAAYNRLKAEGLSQEEIAVKLGDKQLANSLHSENIQGQFTSSVAKMKELFVQIAAALIPIVEPIMAAVGFMANLVSQSMSLLKILGGIGAAFQVIKFLGNDLYRNQILTNLASKTGLITEQQVNVQKKISQIAEKGIIGSKGVSNILAKKGLMTTLKENFQKKMGNHTLLKRIGILIQEGAIKAKDFIVEKANLALQYSKNIATGAYNILLKIGSAIGLKDFIVQTKDLALKYAKNIATGAYNILLGIGSAITTGIAMVNKLNLGTLIAEKASQAGAIVMLGARLAIQTAIAAAALVGVSASTIGIGTAIALAAAAGGIAYLYSVSSGDDVMSPGNNISGYGSRTLMGPEGAIALNNKDTVIAGTNLFPKGNDVISGPAGSVNMAPDNSKMEALLTAMVNKPDPIIEMAGDKLGTAISKYAYSTQ